jgi:hypothetical protein
MPPSKPKGRAFRSRRARQRQTRVLDEQRLAQPLLTRK